MVVAASSRKPPTPEAEHDDGPENAAEKPSNDTGDAEERRVPAPMLICKWPKHREWKDNDQKQ
jgi:hypothetical protein